MALRDSRPGPNRPTSGALWTRPTSAARRVVDRETGDKSAEQQVKGKHMYTYVICVLFAKATIVAIVMIVNT